MAVVIPECHNVQSKKEAQVQSPSLKHKQLPSLQPPRKLPLCCLSLNCPFAWPVIPWLTYPGFRNQSKPIVVIQGHLRGSGWSQLFLRLMGLVGAGLLHFWIRWTFPLGGRWKWRLGIQLAIPSWLCLKEIQVSKETLWAWEADISG